MLSSSKVNAIAKAFQKLFALFIKESNYTWRKATGFPTVECLFIAREEKFISIIKKSSNKINL